MKSKRRRIAAIAGSVVGLLVTYSRLDAYAQIACPPNIPVEQNATAPNDWSVDYAKTPAALSSVTIFEGPPEEQASLKYDDERTTKNEVIQTWELPASNRGYVIVCGYANTTAQLRRKLPNDTRTCQVVLEKDATLGEGGAVVKHAECTSGVAPHKAKH